MWSKFAEAHRHPCFTTNPASVFLLGPAAAASVLLSPADAASVFLLGPAAVASVFLGPADAASVLLGPADTGSVFCVLSSHKRWRQWLVTKQLVVPIDFHCIGWGGGGYYGSIYRYIHRPKFSFWVNYPFKQLLGWNILTFVDVLTVFRMLILSAVVVFIITVSAPRQSNLWTVKCPPPQLCNNNVQWPYIYLLPPPSLYIPVYPFILSHSIIYCTAVYTIICFNYYYYFIYICVFFLFSSYFYCLCVVVVSVNWKLMTLKQILCMRKHTWQ